ncbi:MAG: hypothetical protein D6748_09805 [Calditrichaeota bacterium]|nr:MAG: hypothetical protein D6748_09805 [Calditrichota bacterium]
MSRNKIIFLSIFVIFAGYAIFILTSEGIGSLEKVRARGEINQTIKVLVDHSKGFERDQYGNIVSFYVKDKDNQEAIVNLKKPTQENLENAKVVELLGHMHGNTFVALRVTVEEY